MLYVGCNWYVFVYLYATDLRKCHGWTADRRGSVTQPCRRGMWEARFDGICAWPFKPCWRPVLVLCQPWPLTLDPWRWTPLDFDSRCCAIQQRSNNMFLFSFPHRYFNTSLSFSHTSSLTKKFQTHTDGRVYKSGTFWHPAFCQRLSKPCLRVPSTMKARPPCDRKSVV